ncbi:MAG: hypothetical protein EON58_14915 [Alphaproteobacteria bacterium]|nr:MAG: hypothetical protein EON58_14915 [Alphaproteobacteria bacterium]
MIAPANERHPLSRESNRSDEASPVHGRVAVFTEFGMCLTHGTGAQLLRLFDQPGIDFFHLYKDTLGFGPSTCTMAKSYSLEDIWPFQRGRVPSTKIRQLFSASWWDKDDQVNPRFFRKLTAENQLTCDIAYMVVGSERDAKNALSVLRGLGSVSYIVHIMDIYEANGFDAATTPAMKTLLEGATTVIALTETIREEVEKFAVREIASIPIGQAVTHHVATPRPAGTTARVVMVGKPYRGGSQLLEDSYDLLQKQAIDLEIIYLGNHIAQLPDKLRAVTNNVGQVNDPDLYTRKLAECHLAYLSGPSDADSYGRYSFPSRTSDYFMAGLPTVGCIAPDTATERTLTPLSPDAVRIVRTPEALVDAFNYFLGSEQNWLHASQRVRQFAEQELAIDVVRQKVYSVINKALAKNS